MYKSYKNAIFYGIFFCLLISLAKSYGQNKTVDSLRMLLLNEKNKEKLISINFQLYKNSIRTNRDSAIVYLIKAKELINNETKDSVKIDIYRAYAEQQMIKHKYDSVFFYAKKALDLNTNPTSKKLIDLYSINGTAHYYKGDYVKAIESHLKAEKISNANDLNSGLARVYNNIGIAYIKLENWENAAKYMNKSLKLCKEFDIKRGISYTLGNLGIIYRNLDNYEKAIDMYKQSIDINRKLKDSAAITRNYDNLGTLYEYKEDYKLALENYKNAIAMGTKTQNLGNLALSYHNMASLQQKIKNYDSAKDYYQKSLDLASKLNSKDLLKNIYLGKAILHENLNELQQALKYRKAYEKWNDSIINSEHLAAISELEIKYESEKKEKEILQLSQKQMQNELSIQNQNLWIKRLGYGLLTTLLLFSAGFIIFKQRTSSKKQKEILAAITETQISEQKRISQDLHDSVGGSLALAKTKLTTLKHQEKNQQTFDEILSTLTKTSDEVRQISHDLMPGELVKFGLASAIDALLNQVKSDTLSTNLYTHNTDERIDEKKEVHIFRITQELVQNVLKHAKASTLNIYINKHPKFLNLIVEDNGVGLEATKNNNKGIGFKTINNRIDYLKGKLKIDSQKGKGTSFNIKIPIET